jgi:transmembrane sensor
MDNVHILKPKRSVDEKALDNACDWIAKIDRDLSPHETSEFQTWLYEKPEHLEKVLEVAKMWDKMDDLERLSDIFPENQVQKKSPLFIGSLAASLLLTFTLFFLNFNDAFKAISPEIVMQVTESSYQTKVGQMDTITLPDNSLLVLNTNTIVKMKYTKSVRVLELVQGEIHIDVAHDESRPLSVLANGKMIQAVGTAFNVEVTSDIVELIVTEGKVLVEDKSANQFRADIANKKIKLPQTSLAVSKGEKIDLDIYENNNKQNIVVKLEPIDIISSLSWQEKKLIFRGESLSSVVDEISRYTDLKIELDNNDALKKINVVGVFKTGDIAELLTEFKKHFNISHEKTSENKIKLYFAS